MDFGKLIRAAIWRRLGAPAGASISADIAAILAAIGAIDVNELTTFIQEGAGALDVTGVAWEDLLDKSVIVKPTKICGFKVTVAGAWAGKAKIRITDGAGNKLFPFQAEYIEDTDFTSGVQVILNFPVVVPVADGYNRFIQ